MSNTALTVGEGRIANQTLLLGDGRSFPLGRPGTRGHARRLRKYIRLRLRTEPAFREAFADQYTNRGRLVRTEGAGSDS